MTTFKRGDVVLIAFPFTDLTTTKMRPALILSSDTFNQSHLDIILVAITSQVSKKVLPFDHLLSPEDQNYAGLPKPSLVKLGKVVTIDQRLVRKKLGHVPNPTLGYLTTEIHKILS